MINFVSYYLSTTGEYVTLCIERTWPLFNSFQISFHMPASCDGCTKQLWAPFRPPPAVECRRCRAKFHREHVVSNNQPGSGEGIPPCKINYDPTTAKDMLLMAPSPEEQQVWVSRLLKKIQKSGYKATAAAAAAETSSLGTNGSGSRISPQESMRSSYLAQHSKTGSLPGHTKKQWRHVNFVIFEETSKH